MRIQIAALPVSILTMAVIAFSADSPASVYQQTVKGWRAQHEAKLKAEDGWLTVVGLDWLKDGENRVGSNPSFEVRLPKGSPDRVGTITVKAGKARFKPEKSAAVLLNGAP